MMEESEQTDNNMKQEKKDLKNKLDKIEELKARVRSRGLSMSRVPKQTKKEFILLADSEFCSDYGLTLRYLMDELKKSTTSELIIQKVMELDERVAKLEGRGNQDNTDEEIVTLSGRVLKKRNKKKNKNRRKRTK